MWLEAPGGGVLSWLGVGYFGSSGFWDDIFCPPASCLPCCHVSLKPVATVTPSLLFRLKNCSHELLWTVGENVSWYNHYWDSSQKIKNRTIIFFSVFFPIFPLLSPLHPAPPNPPPFPPLSSRPWVVHISSLITEPSSDPSTLLLSIFPKEMETGSLKDLHSHVHGKMFHTSQSIKNLHVHRWMNGSRWIYTLNIYDDIFFSHEKEGNPVIPVICDNMDEPWGHHVKWNKSDRERQILDNINCTWNLKRSTHESIEVVTRG